MSDSSHPSTGNDKSRWRGLLGWPLLVTIGFAAYCSFLVLTTAPYIFRISSQLTGFGFIFFMLAGVAGLSACMFWMFNGDEQHSDSASDVSASKLND